MTGATGYREKNGLFHADFEVISGRLMKFPDMT